MLLLIHCLSYCLYASPLHNAMDPRASRSESGDSAALIRGSLMDHSNHCARRPWRRSKRLTILLQARRVCVATVCTLLQSLRGACAVELLHRSKSWHAMHRWENTELTGKGVVGAVWSAKWLKPCSVQEDSRCWNMTIAKLLAYWRVQPCQDTAVSSSAITSAGRRVRAKSSSSKSCSAQKHAAPDFAGFRSRLCIHGAHTLPANFDVLADLLRQREEDVETQLRVATVTTKIERRCWWQMFCAGNRFSVMRMWFSPWTCTMYGRTP